MPKLFFILAAIAIGGVLALQPGLNAEVARRLGNPFGAGVVSIFVSFAVVVVLFLSMRQSVSGAPRCRCRGISGSPGRSA